MSRSEESNHASHELLLTENDKKLGYKNPPKATQFKPGQSGNPKGRPKGSTSTAVLLKKALAKPLAFSENGKTKKISRDEAIIQTITVKAVKGDYKFVKLTMDLKERFGFNQVDLPPTNIVITFEDPDPKRLADIKLEDEYFDQLNREQLKEK